MRLRGAIFLIASVLALLSSCDVLKQNVAVSGPKRYKAEVSALALDMKNDIDQSGEISKHTREKFDSVMTRWQKQMSGTGSYLKLGEIQVQLQKIDKNPNEAFHANQQINLNIEELLDILKTEVQ